MGLEKLTSLCRYLPKAIVSPGYWRTIIQTTLAWGWTHSARGLRRVRLEDLNEHPHELSLLRSGRNAFGDTTLMDSIALFSLVRTQRPQKLFEIGTFRGLTTVQLAMNTDESAHIYTLDIEPEARKTLADGSFDAGVADDIVGQLYRQTPYASRITQIFCDSRKFDPAPFAKQIDFVFIDACHDYEFVKNDTDKAMQMIRPGGIIAWHDYSRTFTGVKRCLEELALKQEVCWVEGTYIAFSRCP